MSNHNSNPNPRATEAQRDAVRDEMRQSAETFRKKATGSLFQTFVEHVQSPDGKVLRDFGAMVDGATNGLLSKAIKGMMAPDEPKKSDVQVKEVAKKH